MKKFLVLILCFVSISVFAQYSFTTLAFIDADGAKNCVIDDDGTIFVVKGGNGLVAYDYDGASFTDIGSVSGINGRDVTLMQDGTLIVANNYEGLKAYSFDGTIFTELASVTDGGRALKLVLGADGTIFVANGDSGLWAYTLCSWSKTDCSRRIKWIWIVSKIQGCVYRNRSTFDSIII